MSQPTLSEQRMYAGRMGNLAMRLATTDAQRREWARKGGRPRNLTRAQVLQGERVTKDRKRHRCGICSHVIHGGFVTHHGRRCHWDCWAGTGEQPDIVAERGDYAEVA